MALLIVVAGALGFVYLVVVPSLESRLVHGKLSELKRAAPSLARQVPTNPFLRGSFVENASASANARAVLFDVSSPPLTLLVEEDSRTVSSADVVDDAIARQAALTLAPASGTVERREERFVEIARPTRQGQILLLSASLRDTFANIHLVKRRLLAAGGLALLLALVVGYGGAWAFARRLRRLERAAERIATGRFDQPVVDRGADEVGELARAFERMRQRLAQLDHARRTFIANASHELRTPLFSLSGFLELLTDEDLDEATRHEFLDTMREQMARLTKLATELLDLSRLDAGQLEVQREPLSLAEAARAVVDEFGAVARKSEHRLEVAVDGDAIAIGDEERVCQIGRMLVENALVHAPAGTHVVVRAATHEESAVLTVEDDGPGIAPEHRAHVFERFYRVDGTQASGSGLGLAIASELAQLMGGSLMVESSAGRTSFTVTLPVALSLKGTGKPRRRARDFT